MKSTFFLFFSCILSCFAFALGLVGAPRYGGIFVAIIVANLMALICVYKLNLIGRQPSWLNFSFGSLILYTSLDVIFRAMFGTRILDFALN